MKKVLLALLLCSLVGGAWYRHSLQDQGLCARIQDEAGRPLFDVDIYIWRDTVRLLSAKTDKEGNFCAPLEAGAYTVQVAQEGFATLYLTQVPVNEGKKTSLGTITLTAAVPGLSESITVRYRPPLFEAEPAPTGEAYPLAVRDRPVRPEVTRYRRAEAPSRGEMKSLHEEVAKREKVLTLDKTTDEGPAEAPSTLSTAPAVPSKTPAKPTRPSPASTAVRPGLLTAGEWSDLHNWNHHWVDLLRDGEIAPHQETYRFYPRYRYSVWLSNTEGMPISDAAVKLLDRKGSVLWEARTSNLGQAELWEGLFDDQAAQRPLKVVAEVDGQTHTWNDPLPAEKGPNVFRIRRECRHAQTVDIVWTVDATGSMGDEIDYLKAELLHIIERVQGRFPALDLRMGTVFYRDEGDEYLVKSSHLSRDIDKTVAYIRRQSADGGGDYPEAVHSALEETLRQPWSREAIARVCFLVLDASPHQRPEVIQSLQHSIREAARRGIRIVPITCSGIQKDTEFLMKFFGLATNGTYVFLTDHSGIGDKHLAPTADVYKVELLGDLIVRLIGEYAVTPTCEDGKTPVAFFTEPDPQSPSQQVQPALYYPNPVLDRLTIELPFHAQKVTFYNAEGQAARNLGALPAGKHTLSLADLPAGTYTLRIWHGGAVQSGKVVRIQA